ncbi:hypothetical protein GQ44DRAFT_53446 [Phaeosphaeriaceae sp. PMI808]|nr:hypothetical protein GQ44DRAFT_53446 [Phaeosphaeriaceae sp. PMI808]
MIKIIDEQMLIEDPRQRGTAKAVQSCLTQLLCSHTSPYAGTSSSTIRSVEQQPQSTTFSQLFKLHDRNDLLLRLWQLPAYRDRGTGNVASVHQMGRNVLTDRPNIPLITVEPVMLRSNLSFSNSKRSDSGYAFPWGPEIRTGPDVSTMGEPKSKDKTEDSQSLQLQPVETTHSKESASSATSSSLKPEQSMFQEIIAATRAHNYSEIERLSSSNRKILLERNESNQTLMDDLFDPNKSSGEGFGKLFRLLYDAGVRLGPNTNADYQKKFRKQEKKLGHGTESYPIGISGT